VWVLPFVVNSMGESDAIDPSMVLAGTVLLVASASILVFTGRITSPVPVLAITGLPAGLAAALWIRTGSGDVA